MTATLMFNNALESHDVFVDGRMVFSSQVLDEAVSAYRRLVDGSRAEQNPDDYWSPEPMSQASAEFMARQSSVSGEGVATR